MNGYVAFYQSKRLEVHAATSYEALQKAIAHFNPPRSKRHLVHVTLAEVNGEQVTHTAVD